jgi:hypothetical protein
LANGIRIEGVGHVAWTFLDCQGMLRTLKLPAYYIPPAGIRLLSTLSLPQEYRNEFLHADRTGIRLSGTFGALVGGQRAANGIQATLDPQTNLPVAYTLEYDGSRRSRASGSVQTSTMVIQTVLLDQVARPVRTDLISVEAPLSVDRLVGATPGHRIRGAARTGMTVGPLSIQPAGTILTTKATATLKPAILKIQKQPPSTIFEI